MSDSGLQCFTVRAYMICLRLDIDKKEVASKDLGPE